MIWHFYPDQVIFVPLGSRALCGHEAVERTFREIEPEDERCAACVYLLDVDAPPESLTHYPEEGPCPYRSGR